jgi:hypothetical protein
MTTSMSGRLGDLRSVGPGEDVGETPPSNLLFWGHRDCFKRTECELLSCDATK